MSQGFAFLVRWARAWSLLLGGLLWLTACTRATTPTPEAAAEVALTPAAFATATSPSAPSVATPRPTEVATPTAESPRFAPPPPLPADQALPWEPPMPQLRGAVNDPAALQQALQRPVFVDTTRWVGLWPAEFPAIPFPWPDQAWVLLVEKSTYHGLGGQDASWRVLLEVAQDEATWRGVQTARLEKTGWQAVKDFAEEGGFSSGMDWRPWCYEEVPWIVSMDALAVGDAHTLVSLHLDPMPHGCQGLHDTMMGSGPTMVLLPSLKPPAGVEIFQQGGTGGGVTESENAVLRSSLPLEQVDAAFQEQLRAQGWQQKQQWVLTLPPNNEGERAEVFRLSHWQRYDAERETTVEVLLLLWQPADGATQAMLLGYRPTELRTRQALDGRPRLPVLQVAHDDLALLQRALAALAAFEGKWSRSPAAPSPAEQPPVLWIATAPDPWPADLPPLDPDRWVWAAQQPGGWELALRWDAPVETVRATLEERFGAAQWRVLDFALEPERGFVESQALATSAQLAWCRPDESGQVWAQIFADPVTPTATWVTLSWMPGPALPCTEEALTMQPVKGAGGISPVLALPADAVLLDMGEGPVGDFRGSQHYALWRHEEDPAQTLAAFAEQMQAQGWQRLASPEDLALPWGRWQRLDDQGRPWQAEILLVPLAEDLRFGLLLVIGPPGSTPP